MRPVRLVVVSLAVFLGGVAVAQQPAPPKAKPAAPPKTQPAPAKPPPPVVSVSGFNPRTGRAGTKVTITGTNFSAQDRVLIDGRAVKPLSVSTTTIVLAMPAGAAAGVITVRHPGAATELKVGRFSLLPDAKIATFAPAAGAAGTRVEIKGAGFLPSDQLTFNGKVIAASERAPTRIVVVIPPGARSDYFAIGPAGGVAAKSKRPFKVVIPPPAIGSFAPASGAPGTKVKIFGTSFTADDRAFYGRAPLQIAARSATFLEVTVPANAAKSEPFAVKNAHGAATSAQPFGLIVPPVLTRFAPTSGKGGTRVEIYGDHFRPGDEVHLGGQALRIVDYQERRLTVDIPADGLGNKLTIYRGGQQVAVSKTAFDVLVTPVIAGFSPAAGPVGTRVTITGTGLRADTKVSYGTQRLRVASRKDDDTALEVTIPAGAKDQPFVVATRGGEATSAQPFQIQIFSTLAGIAPSAGPPGTRVTIRGAHFNGADRFYLGTVALAVVEQTADTYVVQIPPAAQSGVIEWESFGKRQASRFKFTLILPPTLASFTPQSGPAGTQVTLTGTDFSDKVTVLFGAEPCKILRTTATELLVVLPPKAAGTDYLWIEYAGKRSRSSATFQVMAPPVISSFAPASGAVGAELTITGANFSESATVLFNGAPATVLRRQLPSQLVVQVPKIPIGGAYLFVVEGKHKIRSAEKFMVAVVPVVSSIAPLVGAPGAEVTIVGANFSARAMVWFGDLPCVVVKRSGKTKLVVQVPSAATGKASFVVEDGGAKVASLDQFYVQTAP